VEKNLITLAMKNLSFSYKGWITTLL